MRICPAILASAAGEAGLSCSVIFALVPTTGRVTWGRALLLVFMMAPSRGGGTVASTALADNPASFQSAALNSVAMLLGFGTVCPKLIKKIVSCEYVDTWRIETNDSCCHSKHARRSLVTDTNVWTECYDGGNTGSSLPHFFIYTQMITKASRTFES